MELNITQNDRLLNNKFNLNILIQLINNNGKQAALRYKYVSTNVHFYTHMLSIIQYVTIWLKSPIVLSSPITAGPAGILLVN